MAAVAPANILSLPLGHLRTLLAACEAFQTWCGVTGDDLGADAGVATALTHIHLVAVNEPEGEDREDRPLAILFWEVGAEGETTAAGETYWQHAGRLSAVFEAAAGLDNARDPLGDADAVITFLNAVGTILEGLEALAGSPGYLFVTGWDLVEGPARIRPADAARGEPDVVQCKITFRWREA